MSGLCRENAFSTHLFKVLYTDNPLIFNVYVESVEM